jgi:hypothetical protein
MAPVAFAILAVGGHLTNDVRVVFDAGSAGTLPIRCTTTDRGGGHTA